MGISVKLEKIFFYILFLGTAIIKATPVVKDHQIGTHLTTKNDHLIATDNEENQNETFKRNSENLSVEVTMSSQMIRKSRSPEFDEIDKTAFSSIGGISLGNNPDEEKMYERKLDAQHDKDNEIVISIPNIKEYLLKSSQSELP